MSSESPFQSLALDFTLSNCVGNEPLHPESRCRARITPPPTWQVDFERKGGRGPVLKFLLRRLWDPFCGWWKRLCVFRPMNVLLLSESLYFHEDRGEEGADCKVSNVILQSQEKNSEFSGWQVGNELNCSSKIPVWPVRHHLCKTLVFDDSLVLWEDWGLVVRYPLPMVWCLPGLAFFQLCACVFHSSLRKMMIITVIIISFHLLEELRSHLVPFLLCRCEIGGRKVEHLFKVTQCWK